MIKLHIFDYTIITYRYFNIQRWDKHHSTQNETAILIIYKFCISITMKNCQKMAENAKINAVLNTHKQLLISDEKLEYERFSDFSRDKEHVDVQCLQIEVSMA